MIAASGVQNFCFLGMFQYRSIVFDNFVSRAMLLPTANCQLLERSGNPAIGGATASFPLPPIVK